MNISEAKIFKEHLKGRIDDFQEFKKVKFAEMLGGLYIWVYVDYRLLLINVSCDSPREKKHFLGLLLTDYKNISN